MVGLARSIVDDLRKFALNRKKADFLEKKKKRLGIVIVLVVRDNSMSRRKGEGGGELCPTTAAFRCRFSEQHEATSIRSYARTVRCLDVNNVRLACVTRAAIECHG